MPFKKVRRRRGLRIARRRPCLPATNHLTGSWLPLTSIRTGGRISEAIATPFPLNADFAAPFPLNADFAAQLHP